MENMQIEVSVVENMQSEIFAADIIKECKMFRKRIDTDYEIY